MSEKKLVLFDVDGTLMQGGIGHVKQQNEAFRNVCGKEVNVRDFNVQGKTDKAIITEVLQSLGYSEKEIVEKLPKVMREQIRIFLEQVKGEERKACPGVKKLLQRLSKMRCRLGLVTGNPREIAFAKLKKAGINKFFSFGGFGENAMQRHELIEMAAREAKEKFNESYSGRKIVVLGDGIRDIQGAKQAGAKAIGVLTGVESADLLKTTNPDYLFKDLSDTEKVLEAIFSD